VFEHQGNVNPFLPTALFRYTVLRMVYEQDEETIRQYEQGVIAKYEEKKKRELSIKMARLGRSRSAGKRAAARRNIRKALAVRHSGVPKKRK